MLKYIFLLCFILVSFVWSVPGRTKKTNPSNNNNNNEQKRQIYSLKMSTDMMDSIGLSLSLSTMIHLPIFTTSPNFVRKLAILSLEHTQIGEEISPEQAQQFEIINGLLDTQNLIIHLPKLQPTNPILSNLYMLYLHHLSLKSPFTRIHKRFIIYPGNVLNVIEASLNPDIQEIFEEIWAKRELKMIEKADGNEEEFNKEMLNIIRSDDQKLQKWLTQGKLSKKFKPFRFKDDCSEAGKNSFFSDRRSIFPFFPIFLKYPWLTPYIEIEVCELTEKMYEKAKKKFRKFQEEALQEYPFHTEAERKANGYYIKSGVLFFDQIKLRLINPAK